MKLAVLETLRARTDWARPADLAEQAGCTAGQVGDAVETLRREGYRIEANAEAGWRFLGCEDRLIPHEITRELGTTVIGRQVTVLESVGSTNDAAWREALDGAPEGTVLMAEEQTAGRGRMGRRWHSPPRANLLMSVILRPELQADRSHLLTAMSSVAAAQALREHLPLPVRIRWPNDLTIRERKVSGILVEGRSLATGSAFVLGIGLNVNLSADQVPPDLRETATSLAMETGRPLNRMEVARWMLDALDRWYRDLRYGDYGRIARCWRRLSSTMGERVVLLENGREFRGRVLDLSMEDGLIVRLDAGVTRLFHASTVTLVRQVRDGAERG